MYEKTIFKMQISEHAKIAYLALSVGKRDNEIISISYREIAEACSFSRKTAMRAIQELMDAEIIQRIYCKSGKELEANAYKVLR